MGLVYYILLIVTAFGSDVKVNKALQNTQNQIELDQSKTVKLAPSPIKSPSQTLEQPSTLDVTPLTPEEQFNVGDRPRGAHVKAIDIEAPVNEEIKNKQDSEKYKSNYKKAVIKEVQSKQAR